MNFIRLDGYKKAAELACRLYPWGTERSLSLLRLSENATFLLTNTADRQPREVMRVSRIGYHSMEEIQAELKWILRLKKQKEVRTACPLPNSQESTITSVEADGQKYVCVVFPYLRGEHPDPLQDIRAWEDFFETGKIAAYLHKNAMEWKESRKLNRPQWDYEHMVGAGGLLGDWRQCSKLNREEYDLLERICHGIRERLVHYGKGDDNFGLIHSDLRAANLLRKDSVIQVIDFDDCGFGWHMYDLAASFSFLEDDGRLKQWVRAWLRGYETILPLKETDIREIPTFIMARRIQLLAWISSHEDSDPVRDLYAGFTEKTVELARQYEEFSWSR